jgi:GTP-binding protein
VSARPVPIVDRKTPLVALVGRPNVGKSTLFNRLVGGHHAIVEDEPGVTRDRRYGDSDYDGVAFRVVDTGGLDFVNKSSIGQSVVRQSLRAVEEAVVLLLVVDAQQGLLPDDRAIADTLRRTGKPVLQVANKVDGPRHENELAELYGLGAAQLFGVSAAHGRGLPELLDALVARLRAAGAVPEAAVAEHGEPPLPRHLPRRERAAARAAEPAAEPAAEFDDTDEAAATDEDGEPAAEVLREPIRQPDVIRIALVGRPNAGKSSLINALCGEERMIVDSTPGTTRDPVDTLIEYRGQRYLLIDTAGIRRRARVYEPMEKVAVAMAEKAVNRADVAILVIDAQAGIGEQDAKIAGLVADAGKALIIAFNKRDLITAQDEKRLGENRDRQLQFVPWALQLSCSAHSSKNVLRLLSEARRCYASFAGRVGTAALNRFFAGIIQKHPPPLHNGKPIRLYYITQAQSRPPTFVVSVNQPEGMHFSYERYLQNQLRETFGLVGTPVRLYARARNRRE